MITDTFENLTEEIIKVQRNENAVKVDACILTFSHTILQYVLENYKCTKIGDLFSSNGANPIYGFEYENRYFAIYMSYVGASACVADIEDSLSMINTDKYVVFGGSGCLNKEIARGKIMVPTSAYRDKSMSFILSNYLNSEFDYVIFTSVVLTDCKIRENILKDITATDYEILGFTLTCSEETLVKRHDKRGDEGETNFLWLRLPPYPTDNVINTDHKSVEEIAHEIKQYIG